MQLNQRKVEEYQASIAEQHHLRGDFRVHRLQLEILLQA